MRQIEDAAAGVLARPDHFFAVVKQIVEEEEAPAGAKTDKIKQLREGMLGEIEGLLRDFDQAAQDREKDLMDQMARLRQLREQVTVIRQGVLPMFASQPRSE
jgi:hypothetical protein